MRIITFIVFSLVLLTSCASKDAVSVIAPDVMKNRVILAIWDSLTAWYGLPEAESYPAQLEAKLALLGYSYRVENAGVSGDTSAGLFSRMDWILEGDTPSLVILCIGANDALQGKSVTDIEANIRMTIEKIKAKNIPILFAGMKAPLNLGWEYGRQYEAMFARLAKEYKMVFMPFLLEWVALKASLNQEDRIHPTKSGYAIVADNILEILKDEKLIEK